MRERGDMIVLECLYTEGSLTSLEIKVEFSYDGTNYGQEQNASTSGGTTTLTPNEFTTTTTGNFHVTIPKNGAGYMKVYAKGTGTTTNSSLAINAYLIDTNF